MKYVILKLTIDAGLHKAFPYIFCDHDVHSVVAEHMTQMLLKQYKDKEVSLHSAGFCGPAENGLECYRGSSSLNIEETQVRCPDDERLLKFIDSTGGILSNDVDAMLDKLENHQREIKTPLTSLGKRLMNSNMVQAWPDGSAQDVVDDGWVLVPREPTQEMISHACKLHGFPNGNRWSHRDSYRAMLAAAPTKETP